MLPTCGSHRPGQRELPASLPGALGWPGPQGDGKAPCLSIEPDSVSAVLFPLPSCDGWTAARAPGKSQTFLDVPEGSELPLSSRAHFLPYLK